MLCVRKLSSAGRSWASPLLRPVFRKPHFRDLSRVEQVLLPAILEEELGTEAAPPDPVVLVVKGEGHLTSAVFTTHPPLISLRFQFKAATN
jgi:hypothetical protein